MDKQFGITHTLPAERCRPAMLDKQFGITHTLPAERCCGCRPDMLDKQFGITHTLPAERCCDCKPEMLEKGLLPHFDSRRRRPTPLACIFLLFFLCH